MKPDIILAKTAKGLTAAKKGVGLSDAAAALLADIDGRLDLTALRRKRRGLTTADVRHAMDELLRGGYVQVLGAPASIPDEASDEDPDLLLSLDFSALRTQRLGAAGAAADTDQVLVTDDDLAVTSPGESDRNASSRIDPANLESEVRGALLKELRPRVEEALRVKLRPKIADELRRAFATALRPRLEAAVRAQLETELKPRIELELRTRFARQIADMRAQLRARGEDDTALTSAESAAPRDDDGGRVMASLSEAVFVTDADGKIVRVNAAWTQLSGHGERDSLGRALSEFFVEGDRRGVGAFLGRVSQGTAIRFDHEGELERAQGGTVFVELRGAPLASGSDGAAGVCGVMREITEARRVATELQDVGLELLLLVDEADAGVIIEDAEGTIKQVNPAFCAMFGVQAAPFSLEGSATSELIQQLAAMFVDADELLTQMARMRAAAEDVDSDEVPLVRGGIARLSYRAVAEDGPPRGHLWIFRLALAPVPLENLP